MKKNFDFDIVVPCYNESTVIRGVIKNYLKLNPNRIIVVDDGSTDTTLDVLKKLPVVVLKNHLNRGPGYSIVRGLNYSYNQPNSDYAVIADADGQHGYKDVKKLLDVAERQSPQIVYATRKLDSNIPLSKRLTNFLVKVVMWILYGISIPDPYCGLRCFRKDVIPHIRFRDRFEWCADCGVFIQQRIKHSVEVSIKADYSEYSMKKGLNLRKGSVLLFKLLRGRIKMLFPLFRGNEQTIQVPNYQYNT